MEINTNMNVSGVNGLVQPGRSAVAAKNAPDTASFPGSAGLEALMGNTPESRSDAVAMAKQLINDPNYPSPEMTRQMSEFLTRNLTSGSSSSSC